MPKHYDNNTNGFCKNIGQVFYNVCNYGKHRKFHIEIDYSLLFTAFHSATCASSTPTIGTGPYHFSTFSFTI